MDAMNKTIETLSKSLESLDKNIGRKLDLVNKSNTELSFQVIPDMSQRITTLEKQGIQSLSPLCEPLILSNSVIGLRKSHCIQEHWMQ